ncbi:hypothetical protein MTO96_015175 [Rhipicephalus appendiculatus]
MGASLSKHITEKFAQSHHIVLVLHMGEDAGVQGGRTVEVAIKEERRWQCACSGWSKPVKVGWDGHEEATFGTGTARRVSFGCRAWEMAEDALSMVELASRHNRI